MNRKLALKFLKKVKRDYDFGGKEFAKRPSPWVSIFELVKRESKTGKVLDIGCGDGRYLVSLKGKGVEYIGIDSCGALLEEARKNFPDYQFRIGDILDLKFGDNTFDTVMCIATLHHIPSRELQLKALSEIYRVLKPGGKLVMTNWCLMREVWRVKRIVFLLSCFFGKKRDCLGFKDLLVPWGITGNKVKRYYYAFSLAELARLVKKVGFRVDEAYYIDRKKKTSFCPSLARWAAFWKRGNLVIVAEK